MDLYPRLLVNVDVIKQNLKLIKKKLGAMAIDLRPHVKTIHDPQLSDVLKDEGIEKICVSNITMLQLFIDAGWRDICLAVPIPLNSIAYLEQLKSQVHDLSLTLYVDNQAQLDVLKTVSSSFRLCIEVDAGQRRSGVDWKHQSELINMIDQINNSQHEFDGLSSHFGFLYECIDQEGIINESGNAMMKILQIKEHLDSHYGSPISISIGDTPSLLAMSYFDGITEIRAGNFLMNDLTIHQKGCCEIHQIACALEAVVVSKSDQDCRFVLHCGSVHLSKEKHLDDTIQFGQLCRIAADWGNSLLPNTFIADLYQEHAVVFTTPDVIKQINIGDHLGVLPVHSCLAMDAMVHKKQVHYITG